MFNVLGQINWLAVAAATIASFVLGGLWFTILFGKHYTIALGREDEPAAKMTPIFIVGPAIWGLVTSIVSAVLMRVLGIDNLADGLIFGLIVGFGYLAATTANTGINPNIPRSLTYGIVSGAYHLVAGLIICLIIAIMG